MAKANYKIELAETLGQGHYYNVWNEKGKLLGNFPSSTTILNAYPQSLQLTKWIAEQGWSESQKIKSDAGIRGTNIHQGIELLLGGKELFREMYSLEEWVKISTFVKWYKDFKPIVLSTELSLFSKKYKYCGKADVVLLMPDDSLIMGDWKSSSAIHNHYPLQVASYAQAYEEMFGKQISATGILQLGAKNKNGYRWVVYDNWKKDFKTFLSVKNTWAYEFGDEPAPIIDLPNTFKL